MDTIGINYPFLVAQLLNFSLIVGHILLMIYALHRLGQTSGEGVRLGWAFLIIFIPLLGSLAFLLSRPSELRRDSQ